MNVGNDPRPFISSKDTEAIAKTKTNALTEH